MLLGVFWVWGVFGFGVWGTWRTPLSLRGRNEEVLAGGNKGPACLDSRHRIHNKSIVPHGARTHAPDYSCTLAASSRRCWPCRPTYLIHLSSGRTCTHFSYFTTTTTTTTAPTHPPSPPPYPYPYPYHQHISQAGIPPSRTRTTPTTRANCVRAFHPGTGSLVCRERDAREEKANARRRSRCTPRKKTTTPAGAALHPYKQHSAIVRVHTIERAVVWYSIVLSTGLLGAGRIRSTRRPTQVDDETHRVLRRSEQLPILNGLLRRRSGARRYDDLLFHLGPQPTPIHPFLLLLHACRELIHAVPDHERY